jgi:hypothetical protein
MKGKIFMTLFALPFFGTGVWMLYSVSNAFYDAYRMNSWVQVEAQVLDGGYNTHRGDDSYTYESYARYRYTVGNETYVADRVSISGGSDNVGDYHQDIGNNLSRARASGERILVYVNPEDPSQAVIDRGIRWGLIGFKSIFLFVFGGVGLGLLIFTWRAAKEKDKSDPRYADSPWLLDDDWQTETIKSSSKASMYGVWIFRTGWPDVHRGRYRPARLGDPTHARVEAVWPITCHPGSVSGFDWRPRRRHHRCCPAA